MKIDRYDRYIVVSTIVGLLIWWQFIGRDKYGMHGQRKYQYNNGGAS